MNHVLPHNWLLVKIHIFYDLRYSTKTQRIDRRPIEDPVRQVATAQKGLTIWFLRATQEWHEPRFQKFKRRIRIKQEVIHSYSAVSNIFQSLDASLCASLTHRTKYFGMTCENESTSKTQWTWICKRGEQLMYPRLLGSGQTPFKPKAVATMKPWDMRWKGAGNLKAGIKNLWLFILLLSTMNAKSDEFQDMNGCSMHK